MAKKNQTTITPTTKFIYVVETAEGLVGSPIHTRTKNPNLAGSWTDELEAARVAKSVGGIVKTQQIVDHLATAAAPKTVPAPVGLGPTHQSQPQMFSVPGAPSVVPATTGGESKGTKARKPAQTKPEATVKAPRGPAHAEVVALLQSTGLLVTEKSSSHYGGIKGAKTLKGPRLVLPRGKSVTRLYLYEMPDAVSLLGYKTAEERKTLGLGAVTHVADITTIDQVKALIAAVCEANGIQLKQDGKPKAKRTRKSTPAQGTEETATEESEVTK